MLLKNLLYFVQNFICKKYVLRYIGLNTNNSQFLSNFFFFAKGGLCVLPYNGSFSRNINFADMMTLQGQGRFLPAAADIPVNSIREIENRLMQRVAESVATIPLEISQLDHNKQIL